MPILISYSRADSDFVDKLAANLVAERHHIWMDRWELNIGDSLIAKIQEALTESSAIIVIVSKNSVASEWCKKELNSGFIRELTEKSVLILPCIIDDCTIPLFLQEKVYADFRKDTDAAFKQVSDSLLRITNRQQGRIESPDFHTDWSYDWKRGKSSKLWYFDFTFVDHGSKTEYVILTRCQMACNHKASAIFQSLNEINRQKFIHDSLVILSSYASRNQIKLLIKTAFEVSVDFLLEGKDGLAWYVELSTRRMGIDNGKDTLMHIDQILERTVASTEPFSN